MCTPSLDHGLPIKLRAGGLEESWETETSRPGSRSKDSGSTVFGSSFSSMEMIQCQIPKGLFQGSSRELSRERDPMPDKQGLSLVRCDSSIWKWAAEELQPQRRLCKCPSWASRQSSSQNGTGGSHMAMAPWPSSRSTVLPQ